MDRNTLRIIKRKIIVRITKYKIRFRKGLNIKWWIIKLRALILSCLRWCYSWIRKRKKLRNLKWF